VLIDDPVPSVRRAAAAGLGNLGRMAASQATALLAASLQDSDEDVRFAAAVSLGTLGEAAPPQVQQLAEVLRTAGDKARQAAADALTSGRSQNDTAKPLEAWKRFNAFGRG